MISDFRSVWCRQIELVMIIPHRERIMKGYDIKFVVGLSMMVMHSIP